MFFILGPCVIESENHALFMAARIRTICRRLGVEFMFKSSYDKANRTSAGSFRGPGLHEGMKILKRVKEEVGVQVISDIHEPGQAAVAAEVLDMIQIPALLSRQTDLIVAAARTGRPLNIKKGQFMAPEDMRYAAEKALASGAREVWLTERGTTFGYRDLVVDMRSIPRMRALGFPVIIDATHAIQQPGSGGGKSAGAPELIPMIAKAAVASGADGVFLEVHDDPAKALSDGPNSLLIDELEPLLKTLIKIREATC